MYCYSYLFPVGRIWIAGCDDAITEISWSPIEGVQCEIPLIIRTARQLEEYFAGTRIDFDMPLRASGTAFRQRVWEALRTIPYAETRTYGEIARLCGFPNASRAVGGACHNNPISIIVPCHRVVGVNGLTGYAGGLDKKKFLLKLEETTQLKRAVILK